MSDDDRVIGNSVQKAMEAVVEAWESALNKIRECKQEYQAQLEELAGMGGVPTRAQALGILKSFYERVNGLRNTLNQPAAHEALPQVESPATAIFAAPVTPMPRKRLTKLVFPKGPVAASSEPSEQQATTTESQAESPSESQPGRSATPGPSASCDPQSEDVNNRKDKGKDKAIDTSTTITTTTTPTKSSGSSKSGSGSIVTKKDIKGKGRAKSNSPSPLPFSAKTLNKITKTVNNRKTSRLPLIKPVSTLKLASLAATIRSGSVPGPSEQRPTTPEPESESESETEYLSVLEFHRSLSATPDASSTPGPSLTTAAAATAGASDTTTSDDTLEQLIVGIEEGKLKDQVLDCDPTSIATEESNSASASGSGSGSNSITNDIQETQGSNVKEIQGEESNIKETKGKEKAIDSDTPTKTTNASGSGLIPSKKDLKGKGKAIARSPSPGLSSTKSNNNKVTKSSKNNKENQPLSRRSPSVTGSSEPALNSKSNNNNIQEEIIVKLDKGKGKAIASPTLAPTTTEDVDGKDEFIVITTTAASITAKASTTSSVNDKASNNGGNSNTTSASSSTSGPGTIPNKKDPKVKGKAIATSPSPSPRASPGPSSPKTKPNNNTDRANITKVTKRPAAARERQTIKRSLAKKGQHWAFKLEAQFAGSMTADQVQQAENKFFILCCPAPNCPSPNFGGKHPFREGRAKQHFAGGDCLMEIDGREEQDITKDGDVDEDGDVDADGDIEMTEAEIFERFGAEIVQEQKRWPVDDKWARKNNRELCMKVAEGEEREGMLRELD